MLFKNKCRINANYLNILGIHMKMWQHRGFCLRYFMNIKGLICDADWLLPLDHFIIILSFKHKYWFFKFCLHRQWVWRNIFLSLSTTLVLQSVTTWKNTAYNFKNVARLLSSFQVLWLLQTSHWVCNIKTSPDNWICFPCFIFQKKLPCKLFNFETIKPLIKFSASLTSSTNILYSNRELQSHVPAWIPNINTIF